MYNRNKLKNLQFSCFYIVYLIANLNDFLFGYPNGSHSEILMTRQTREEQVPVPGKPICSMNSTGTSWIIIAKSKEDLNNAEANLKLNAHRSCDTQELCSNSLNSVSYI